jgi:DNA ligase (NAD+)
MNEKILIPTHCPSCDAPLDTINVQLFCSNKNCTAKCSKQLRHFVSTIGIKGLGEKTLAKLELESIAELYLLTYADLVELIGSEKIAEKLIQQINESRNAPLNKIIAAFGIQRIGNTAANKLVKVITKLDEITEETCKEAGLGEKDRQYLLDFMHGEYAEIKHKLPSEFNEVHNTEASNKTEDNVKVLDKGVICITGKLKSFKTKAQAKEALINLGFNVVESVTKSTDFLVDEENIGSTKRIKADRLSIAIIPNLLNFIEEIKQ